MQLPIESQATVRAVDLDCDRRLSASGWLAIFEQVRWEAWFQSGHGHAEQGRDRLHFVVRAQHLSVGSDVVPGDELRLALTLEAVGETSVTFGHRAVRRSDGVEVARCSLVAVMIGGEGRPLRVPDDMRALCTPSGLEFPPARPWSSPPSECWAAVIHTRRSDLDLLGHVNQAHYADFVLDAFAIACHDTPELAAMRLEYDHEVRDHFALEFVGWPLPGGVHHVLGRANDTVCLRATLWER